MLNKNIQCTVDVFAPLSFLTLTNPAHELWLQSMLSRDIITIKSAKIAVKVCCLLDSQAYACMSRSSPDDSSYKLIVSLCYLCKSIRLIVPSNPSPQPHKWVTGSLAWNLPTAGNDAQTPDYRP